MSDAQMQTFSQFWAVKILLFKASLVSVHLTWQSTGWIPTPVADGLNVKLFLFLLLYFTFAFCVTAFGK